jgi:S1-C subfamily serine protease
MLGARPAAVFQSDAESLGLPDLNGALLVAVEQDSPAMRSGLQVNDVVRSWNGEQIDEFVKLYRFVSMTRPDSIAKVEIIRDGKTSILDVTVGARRDWFGSSGR